MLTTDGWQCQWNAQAPFVFAPCTRIACDVGGRLHRNKMAIVYEYLGLIYGVYGMLTGVATIRLLDARMYGAQPAPAAAVAH